MNSQVIDVIIQMRKIQVNNNIQQLASIISYLSFIVSIEGRMYSSHFQSWLISLRSLIILKILSSQWFCEDVSNLFSIFTRHYFNQSLFNIIPEEVMSYINVFGPFMLNRIFIYVNWTCGVTHDRNKSKIDSIVTKLLLYPK